MPLWEGEIIFIVNDPVNAYHSLIGATIKEESEW
jgi:hypothetical protein